MADNRYRDYLSGTPSSRFVQSGYGAQNDQLSPLRDVAGIALGAVLLGSLAHTGALRRPLGTILDRASRYRGVYTKAIGQGLSEWARHPADLDHGLNMLRYGQFKQGFNKLGTSIKSLGTSINTARERLTLESMSALHGMPSAFESAFGANLSQQQDLSLRAEYLARRNLIASRIMSERISSGAQYSPLSQAYQAAHMAVSGMKSRDIAGLTANKWHDFLKATISTSYDESVANELWENIVSRSRPTRRKFGSAWHSSADLAHVPDRVSFLSDEQHRLLRRYRQGREQLNEQQLLELTSRYSAQRDYYKMYRQHSKKIREDFFSELMINNKRDAEMMRMAGIRQATVGDVRAQVGRVVVNRPNGQQVEVDINKILADSRGKRTQAMMKMSAGAGLYVNKSGQLLDMRTWMQNASDIGKFAYNEMQIPFVKINPLQLFHVPSIARVKAMRHQRFINAGDVHPTITGFAGREDARVGNDLVRIGSHLYDFETGKQITVNGKPMEGYLAPTSHGILVNSIAKMAGVSTRHLTRHDSILKPDSFIGSAILGIGKFLDVGFQDAPNIFQRWASVVTKFFDDRWEGNQFYRLLNTGGEEGELFRNASLVSKAIEKKTISFSDESWNAITSNQAFQDLYGDVDIDFSNPQAVMDTLGALIRHGTSDNNAQIGAGLSSRYRSGLLKQWNIYAKDPQSFLGEYIVTSNKAPLAGVRDISLQGPTDPVKKLIQKELLANTEQLMNSRGEHLDLFGLIDQDLQRQNLSRREAQEAKFTALNYILDNSLMNRAGEDSSQMAQRLAGEFNGVTPESTSIRQIMADFKNSRFPDWQLGYFEVPEREYYINSSQNGIWINKAKPLPMKEGWELVKDLNDKTKQDAFFGKMGDWWSQFGAGRGNMDQVTTGTFFPYIYGERLVNALGNMGLGLSNANLGSAADVWKNIMTRRWAPAYLGLGAGGGILSYLNWQMGQFTGVRPTEAVAYGLMGVQKATASLRDFLGITGIADRLQDITPGSEMFWELPGMNFLDPTKSREEVDEYYENGEDPVRKGRYWPMGNTPYVGGKVSYYQPNWFQRATHDYMNTDVAYGSGSEHWSHVWFPTLQNPLNPITYWFDQYHYEKKHYWDRPYPETGGVQLFEEIPVVGPAIDATLGQVIKPRRVMHEGELAEPYGTKSSEEIVADINADIKRQASEGAGPYGKITSSGQMQLVKWMPVIGEAVPGFEDIKNFVGTVDPNFVPTMGGGYGSGSGSAMYSGPGIYEYGDKGAGPGSSIVGGTGSAGKRIVKAINSGIKSDASAKGYGYDQSYSVPGILMNINQTPTIDGSAFIPSQGMLEPWEGRNALGKAWYGATEIGGIYGYLATTMFGSPYENSPVVQTSSRMTSTERAFWDLDLGGLGSDVSEIGRRFLPHKQRGQQEWNPIRNTQADWMPGPEYFIDFKHGDPYIAVPKGEMRLPGSGYEMFNEVPGVTMRLGASDLGSSVQEMVSKLASPKASSSRYGQDDTTYSEELGNKLHKKFQDKWVREGLALKEDTEREVYDREHNIIGYVDAILNTAKGREITDIKTMNPEKFDEALRSGQPYLEHVEQVNFYMHASGIEDASLLYVDSKDTNRQIYFQFQYDDDLFQRSMKKLDTARNIVEKLVDSGRVNRFDLYDTFNRFKILADVAPYSQQYKFYASLVTKNERLTEDERAEIQQIKDQVSQKKKSLRLFPYQFRDTKIDYHVGIVDKVLDNSRFMIKGDDSVYKLAGVNVSSAKNNPVAAQADALLNSYIAPGKPVVLGTDADSLNVESNDTLNTIRTVVYSPLGVNVNKKLISTGLAEEDDEDTSPAGVHARFNSTEIFLGSLWERFAHLDTPFHTKFLQVRSPLEDYKRREVYGKNWQSWDDPWGDYVVPTFESYVSRNPVVAAASGAFLASLSVRSFTAKMGAAAVGAIVTGSFAATRAIGEIGSDRDWIPDRRREERSIDEYFDILEYMKASGLKEYALKMASKWENTHPLEKLRRIGQFGEYRQTRLEKMAEEKRQLVIDGKERNKEKIKDLNKEIERIRNYKTLVTVNPWERKVMEYDTQMRQTLYGADPYGNVQDFMSALPKKDRAYATEFLKHSTPDERKEILRLVPENQRSFYQAQWGMEVDEKPTLKDYFKDHYLPDENWEGWDPNHSLDEVKIKVIRNEGAELAEFGYWPQDEQAADANEAPALPYTHNNMQGSSLAKTIEATLRGLGLTNLSVNAVPIDQPVIQMDVDYMRDRRGEFEDYAKSNFSKII